MAICCFCGRTGKLTKEHVWPKWLRKWPAYEVGRKAFGTGQQVRLEPVSSLDPDGRIQVSMTSVGRESQYLPFVTVPVCAQCNNGWMSHLEQGAQRVMTPLINLRPHQISVPDQRLLTVWAAKCLYAYASVFHPQNLPFTAAEFQALREKREPPDRCAVWIGHSMSQFAQVAMIVEPTLVTSHDDGYANLHSRAANIAQGYLAAHSVVFIAHWIPQVSPDVYELLFAPPIREGLARISDPTEQLNWPPAPIPAGLLATQRTHYLSALHEAIGLPWEGHTEKEAGHLADRYMAGESPADLRRDGTLEESRGAQKTERRGDAS